MHTEFNFMLTERANAAAAAHDKASMRFKTDEPLPVMATGDLFSTEELMPLVFVIARRHIHLVTPSHLQIEYLLDVQS